MNRNNRIGLMVIGLIISSSLFLSSCSKKSTYETVITSLSIDSGSFGTSVKITGTGFSTALADNQVFFNNKVAMVTAATSTQLTATVPIGAGTGPVSVSIKNGERVSGPTFVYEFTAVVTTLVGNINAFSVAWGIAIDTSGNLYVCDKNRFVIRKVTPYGMVTTLAGSGHYGSNDGTGTAASFSEPLGISFDNQDNLLVADFVTNLIRKITLSGVVTTLQVTHNQTGYNVPFFTPVGVAVDGSNNIYVSWLWHLTRVSANGTAIIFAGADQSGQMDGPHGIGQLAAPQGIRSTRDGIIYIADANKIRYVDGNANIITLAGSKNAGYKDGHGDAAMFNGPSDLVLDNNGNIFIADRRNHLIRKMTIADLTVTTVAGNIKTASSVDGVGSNAGFADPIGICIDKDGALYVTDGSEIRKIVFK